MKFVDEKNIPGLLLIIDFEKAYDSLSWSFMENALKSFKFGLSIMQWISTFYLYNKVVISPPSFTQYEAVNREIQFPNIYLYSVLKFKKYI